MDFNGRVLEGRKASGSDVIILRSQKIKNKKPKIQFLKSW